MPPKKTDLFQDASWKGSTEGNPTGSGKNTSEDRNMEIVINGPRKDNVPEEIRSAFKHDVNKKQTGKRRRSRSQSEPRRHSKGDGKRRYQKEVSGMPVDLTEAAFAGARWRDALSPPAMTRKW